MKILVTGASSMLGANLLIELSEQGFKPVGLVRETSDLKAISDTKAEFINGDITSINDIERAAEGCDAIIHAAALADHSVASYLKFQDVNVTGSINIINVAIKNGIRRVIYISTANTIGYGTADNPGSESDPPLPPYTGSYYVRSKIEAEKAILEKASGTGVEVIIINPTFMLGAYDVKPTSGEAVLRGLRSRVITVTRGGKNFVSATDVAKAACNALKMGRHGQRYLVTGSNMDFAAFYREMNRLTGLDRRIVVLPSFLFLLAGYIMQPLFLAGINTRINLVNMKMLCSRNYYRPGMAVTELQTPVTPVSKGITESVNWFRKNGYCQA